MLSLKPYLKESRKSKVEQYVQLLNMTKVMEAFRENGGEKIKWCFLILILIPLTIDGYSRYGYYYPNANYAFHKTDKKISKKQNDVKYQQEKAHNNSCPSGSSHKRYIY